MKAPFSRRRFLALGATGALTLGALGYGLATAAPPAPKAAPWDHAPGNPPVKPFRLTADPPTHPVPPPATIDLSPGLADRDKVIVLVWLDPSNPSGKVLRYLLDPARAPEINALIAFPPGSRHTVLPSAGDMERRLANARPRPTP